MTSRLPLLATLAALGAGCAVSGLPLTLPEHAPGDGPRDGHMLRAIASMVS